MPDDNTPDDDQAIAHDRESPSGRAAWHGGTVVGREMLRGLVVGVGTLAASAAAGSAAFGLAPEGPPPPCDEGPCLPDPAPIILVAAAVLVAMLTVGPVLGWLLRFPRPWRFGLPVGMLVATLCLPMPRGDSLLIAHPLVATGLLLLSYPGLAALHRIRPSWRRRNST